MNEHGHKKLILTGFVFYFIAAAALFFYSFTQVDLNLTLSQITLASAFQDFFQYIGYFHRPESTYLYVAIVAVLFLSYAAVLRYTERGNLSFKGLKRVVIALSLILLFSYPAFSYDIYNYMFDARIVTKYQENPYGHKALDYPDDSWVNFMRWTHRTYPYGPVWLGLTVPLSYIGSEKFVGTLLLFKGVAVVSYLASCLFMYKTLFLVYKEKALAGTLLFALNPLVIVESLVSGHNDIAMMAFALISLFFLLQKKYAASFILLLLSIGIKFATVFLLPGYLYILFMQWKHVKVDIKTALSIMLAGMVGAIIAASIRTQFQPWYLLYVYPFLALLYSKISMRLVIILSVMGLSQYVPFLLTGNWNPPIPSILNTILLIGLIFSLYSISLPFLMKKLKASHY